jgi:hypothetical protein
LHEGMRPRFILVYSGVDINLRCGLYEIHYKKLEDHDLVKIFFYSRARVMKESGIEK